MLDIFNFYATDYLPPSTLKNPIHIVVALDNIAARPPWPQYYAWCSLTDFPFDFEDIHLYHITWARIKHFISCFDGNRRASIWDCDVLRYLSFCDISFVCALENGSTALPQLCNLCDLSSLTSVGAGIPLFTQQPQDPSRFNS